MRRVANALAACDLLDDGFVVGTGATLFGRTELRCLLRVVHRRDSRRDSQRDSRHGSRLYLCKLNISWRAHLPPLRVRRVAYALAARDELDSGMVVGTNVALLGQAAL